MPIDYSWIGKQDIAHRGLYKSGSDFEENSLAAIEKAVQAGFAVEIDVRMTADNHIVAFHDARLERLTNGKGYISEYTYKELSDLTLGYTGEKIPTLNDVLDLIDEDVPLYIEAKCPIKMDPDQFCGGIRYCLEGYIGDVGIMSFHPGVVKWLKSTFPDIARGLILDFRGLSTWRRLLATNFYLTRLDPHFLAVDVNSLPTKLARKWREKEKPLLTWTVKSKGQTEVGRDNADALIFEAPALIENDLIDYNLRSEP